MQVVGVAHWLKPQWSREDSRGKEKKKGVSHGVRHEVSASQNNSTREEETGVDSWRRWKIHTFMNAVRDVVTSVMA